MLKKQECGLKDNKSRFVKIEYLIKQLRPSFTFARKALVQALLSQKPQITKMNIL